MKKNSQDIKIYCVFHKPYPIIFNSVIYPILSGSIKKDPSYALHYPTDEGLDNIVQYNYSFSELTSMYSVWKNTPPCSIVGFCHYRRFFDFILDKNLYISSNNRWELIKSIYERTTAYDIINTLTGHDLIMSGYYVMDKSIENSYIENHIVEDWDIMYKCLQERYPEYYETGKDYFSQSNKIMPCNMFVTYWEKFDQLMSWLFPLLFDIHSSINYTNRSVYQARVIGFLSERLINLYMVHNNLNIRMLPVIFTD